MRSKITIATIAAALAVTPMLAGCGSDDDSSAASTTTRASAAATTAKTFDTVCTADDVVVGGEPDSRPEITIPDTCGPPTQLLTKDLTAGTGAEVVAGTDATVQYQLVTWSDKAEKDASWDRNKPFTVEKVGQAPVIDGWNEGLIGMKEGGRRLLIVPPELGYGKGGNGIKPNETLVFVIDAVAVN
ncbi:FKBP-type peptidyl-prolyl cis-trans isomerase [Antrihabitans spumae]|uniref:Peptidyl-prolyl cis-trans isomerase n=1 Tax=Antrihabitans spumae TaxID=3373370 RepID=A0ABW7K722_9NOCA